MMEKENQNNWKKINLGQILELNYGKSLPQKVRIKGKYPVFGSNGIVDYHNKALVKGPGLIIGRKGSSGAVHYTNEDFWPIDTTYYVTLRSENDLKFISYLLSSLSLSQMNYHSTIPGLNREIAYQVECNLPSLSEQKKISTVLSNIQKAIEAQDTIIKTTQELKKSTMQYLFTHGLHGEKTKQTEIGEIPESWELKQIKKVIIKTEQINPLYLSVKNFEYIDVSSINRDSLKIESTTTTLKTNAPGRARKLVKTGDVIIATVRPTLKRLAYIEEQYDNQICSTAFCVLRSNPDFMENKFLFYLMQQSYIYGVLETVQSGASYPAVTDKNIHYLLIALPSKQEQVKITHLLESIDNKIYNSNFKKTYLQQLFNSMLNKLMTGEIKVNDLRID